MLLNSEIINKIDSFFSKVFESLKDIVSWSTFFTLLAGIVIGFVICSTIYGITLLKSVKKESGKIKLNTTVVSEEELLKIVNEIKTSFVDETEGLSVKYRFEVLGSKLVEVASRIACLYYPNSKYPLYELTVEELIMFLEYLSKRIEGVFDKPILKHFKKISISQVFKILDTKKKIDESKVTKIIKKTQPSKIKSAVMVVLKVANPVYWVKKLIIGTTIDTAVRKASLLVIDIVAEETSKTYSKSLFNEEKTLKMLEIEKQLEELEGEEIDG